MNENKNIESPLSGLPKKNPFKTPEGYFENLQDRIEARIEAEDTVVPRQKQIVRMLKPALSLAASFALIFLLVYYPLKTFLPEYLESKQVVAESNEFNMEEDFFAVFSDDNSLIEYISQPEEAELQPSDEIYAYLSVQMTDTEFYNEIINN